MSRRSARQDRKLPASGGHPAPYNSSSGAWEVAVRYSAIDLNDAEAEQQHGKSNSMTVGVNYYPNANIKMMLNYGVVNNDIYATGKDDQFMGDYDFSYLQMRFQTAF